MSQINKIKQLMGLLTENVKVNGYGCVMLFLKFPEFKSIQSKIDKNDLYTKEEDDSFGLENDPHVTVLYGLHKDVSNIQIKDSINGIEFGPISIYKVSLFECDDFDVLKYGVSNSSLSKANVEVSKLPNTNMFPDFHPHLTIAYVKKGKGEKYIKLLTGDKYELQPINVVFSEMNGKQNKIQINK